MMPDSYGGKRSGIIDRHPTGEAEALAVQTNTGLSARSSR